MSDGGTFPWKRQIVQGNPGDYTNLSRPLPNLPKGKEWYRNPETREWSIVDKKMEEDQKKEEEEKKEVETRLSRWRKKNKEDKVSRYIIFDGVVVVVVVVVVVFAFICCGEDCILTNT